MGGVGQKDIVYLPDGNRQVKGQEKRLVTAFYGDWLKDWRGVRGLLNSEQTESKVVWS